MGSGSGQWSVEHRASLRAEYLVCEYVPETACLSIIVLGDHGDLVKKKTFPALFHLYRLGFIQSQDVHIFGYARTKISDNDLRACIRGRRAGKTYWHTWAMGFLFPLHTLILETLKLIYNLELNTITLDYIGGLKCCTCYPILSSKLGGCYRQWHKVFFEKSDLFFVCMMRLLSFDIQIQELEIEAAKWMPVEEVDISIILVLYPSNKSRMLMLKRLVIFKRMQIFKRMVMLKRIVIFKPIKTAKDNL